MSAVSRAVAVVDLTNSDWSGGGATRGSPPRASRPPRGRRGPYSSSRAPAQKPYPASRPSSCRTRHPSRSSGSAADWRGGSHGPVASGARRGYVAPCTSAIPTTWSRRQPLRGRAPSSPSWHPRRGWPVSASWGGSRTSSTGPTRTTSLLRTGPRATGSTCGLPSSPTSSCCPAEQRGMTSRRRADSGKARTLPFPSRFAFERPDADPWAVRDKYHLPERWLLCADQFWKHKNHLLLVRALGLLAGEGLRPTVVLTGLLTDYRDPSTHCCRSCSRRSRGWALPGRCTCWDSSRGAISTGCYAVPSRRPALCRRGMEHHRAGREGARDPPGLLGHPRAP